MNDQHIDPNDPIAVFDAKMNTMSQSELKGMVLISANIIGGYMSGKPDFDSNEEALHYMLKGIDLISNRYDIAETVVQGEGTSN